jgi:glucose/arabinose dehydrogenase
MTKLLAIMLLAGVTACSGAAGVTPTADVPAAAPPGEPGTVVKDLAVPWAIAFLPGGDALVTERDTSRLLRVSAAGKVAELGRIAGVEPSGEGGLLGVATKDGQVFVYYTAADDNRIARYRLDGDRLSDPKVTSGASRRAASTTAAGWRSAPTAISTRARARPARARPPRTATPSAARSCA